MSIHIAGGGADGLAPFGVMLPGHCASCDTDTDVVLKYHAPKVTRALKERLDLTDLSLMPSLILKPKQEIGITCGCYASFQRQVAHVSHTRKGRSRG